MLTILLSLLPGTLAPTSTVEPPSAGSKIEWTAQIDRALELASAEQRVVMVALGEAQEGRTRRHVREVYPNKVATKAASVTVNVPAWSFTEDESKKLPKMKGVEPRNHRNNLATVMEQWITPNANGVIALPHHLWLGPDGSLLLSCPWELEPEELAWCTDEALRRSGIEERPELPDGARAPRRLLVGESFRVIDEDELGRGLETDELEEKLSGLAKRFIGMGDRGDVIQIMFTDEPDASDFLAKQIGLWDFGGGRGGGGGGAIVDGTVELLGTISPANFIEVLDETARSPSSSRRLRTAVALEQIGSPDGLSLAKKGWKSEKDEAARPEWIRALAACGRSDKGSIRTVIKAAAKDDNPLVRRSALIGLGHTLPNKDALKALEAALQGALAPERDAAVLALALGRARDQRSLVQGVLDSDLEDQSRRTAEATMAVLEGGPLYSLSNEFKRISESEVERGRIFFRPVGENLETMGR